MGEFYLIPFIYNPCSQMSLTGPEGPGSDRPLHPGGTSDGAA